MLKRRWLDNVRAEGTRLLMCQWRKCTVTEQHRRECHPISTQRRNGKRMMRKKNTLRSSKVHGRCYKYLVIGSNRNGIRNDLL